MILWNILLQEAREQTRREPGMAAFLAASLLGRASFADALAHRLAGKLAGELQAAMLVELFASAYHANPDLLQAAEDDLLAAYDRDPACRFYFSPLLFYKGYHALQSQRIAHFLWQRNDTCAALYLQHMASERFAVDIHPGVAIGAGVFLDHATGFVAGETAVIERDVSLLHGVTLGGVGNDVGDRHPKIRQGAFIGAGAMILGNVEVGARATVGAGSVVLKPVSQNVTVVGVPAQPVIKAQ